MQSRKIDYDRRYQSACRNSGHTRRIFGGRCGYLSVVAFLQYVFVSGGKAQYIQLLFYGIAHFFVGAGIAVALFRTFYSFVSLFCDPLFPHLSFRTVSELIHNAVKSVGIALYLAMYVAVLSSLHVVVFRGGGAVVQPRAGCVAIRIGVQQFLSAVFARHDIAVYYDSHTSNIVYDPCLFFNFRYNFIAYAA